MINANGLILMIKQGNTDAALSMLEGYEDSWIGLVASYPEIVHQLDLSVDQVDYELRREILDNLYKIARYVDNANADSGALKVIVNNIAWKHVELPEEQYEFTDEDAWHGLTGEHL